MTDSGGAGFVGYALPSMGWRYSGSSCQGDSFGVELEDNSGVDDCTHNSAVSARTHPDCFLYAFCWARLGFADATALVPSSSAGRGSVGIAWPLAEVGCWACIAAASGQASGGRDTDLKGGRRSRGWGAAGWAARWVGAGRQDCRANGRHVVSFRGGPSPRP